MSRHRRERTVSLVAVCCLLLGGCAASRSKPELGSLYSESARFHGIDRNPVILIPGILGSKLVSPESGQIVWGAFTGNYADPGTAEGSRLLALPMGEGRPLRDLQDGVIPGGALDNLKISILGLPLDIGAYVNILSALGIGGYRDETLARASEIDYGKDHFTCFQFDYDWRRDNVENAQRLHEFILAKRAYVQQELEKRYGVADHDVRFDLVAHSMGGLLARYYLRYGNSDLPADGSIPSVTWAGAALVDRAVLIGPPNAGAADALMQLIEGKKFGLLFPTYDAALLGTMPAVYQLLPRGRHGFLVDAADHEAAVQDVLDPDFWQKMKWGLASPEQAGVLARLLPEVPDPEVRLRIALDHQRKCLARARQFSAALDTPANPPAGLELVLMAGDALPTLEKIAVSLDSGDVEPLASGAGDGTVLRSSALMDERVGGTWAPGLVSPIVWEQVIFLFSEHIHLTKDPAFTDNMLYLLLEDPRRQR